MISAPRVAILVDSRRTPLYEPGLLERLRGCFEMAGAITQVLDLLETPPSLRPSQVDPFDALYPLPVVPSAALTDAILFGSEPPWLVNPIRVQLQSLDKRLTLARLQHKGIPYPETLQTSDPKKVVQFVRRHGRAIIKSPDNVAGLGHYVVEEDEGRLIASIPNLERHRQLRPQSVAQRPSGRRVPLELLRRPRRGDGVRDPRQPAATAPYLVQRLVGANTSPIQHQVFRLYVIGAKPLFGSARILTQCPPNDLSYAIVNYAWGGEYRLFKLELLEAEAIDVGLSAARALEIEVGAIDLIEDEKGRWLVLEGETDNLVYHLCRGFRSSADYCPAFDLDSEIARWVVGRLRKTKRGATRPRARRADARSIMRLLSGD